MKLINVRKTCFVLFFSYSPYINSADEFSDVFQASCPRDSVLVSMPLS